jgi:Nitrous oxide-stimulated promoter
MKPNQQIRQREQQTLERMLGLYCHAHHGDESLCDACAKLLSYAEQKATACPYGEGKPTCKQCTMHCYAPEQREHIRAVMKYAGPRMLFHHPLDTIRHMWRSLQR